MKRIVLSIIASFALSGSAHAEVLEFTCYERQANLEESITLRSGWLQIDMEQRHIQFMSISRERYETQALVWGPNQITWQDNDQSNYSVIFFGFYKGGLLTKLTVELNRQRVFEEHYVCNNSDYFRYGFPE